MNYTEEQILEKAKTILQDLQGKFFKEENIDKIWFEEKDEVARPRGKIMPAWTVSINEPIFDSTNFLTISDETGEPLYIQSSHKVVEIEKDTDGNYLRKE
jgi:hypothetical protein